MSLFSDRHPRYILQITPFEVSLWKPEPAQNQRAYQHSEDFDSHQDNVLSWPNTEDGFEDFSHWLQQFSQNTQPVYLVLIEHIREQIVYDNLPRLKGKDKARLLTERLRKHFPESRLHFALDAPIHQPNDQLNNQEQKLLFSLGNEDNVWHWLQALKIAQAKIAGVYSSALLLPHLLTRLGKLPPASLLITCHEHGMRESYILSGVTHLTRVLPYLKSEQSLVTFCLSELPKLYDYLKSKRLLHTNELLPVFIIAHEHELTSARQSIPKLPGLHIGLLSYQQIAEQFGLIPQKFLGIESILRHLLQDDTHPLENTSLQQFADNDLLHTYRRNQQTGTLKWIGGILLLLILCASLLYGWKLSQLHDSFTNLDTQHNLLEQRHTTLKAEYTKLPFKSAQFLQVQHSNTELIKENTELFKVLQHLRATLQAVPEIHLVYIKRIDPEESNTQLAQKTNGLFNLVRLKVQINSTKNSNGTLKINPRQAQAAFERFQSLFFAQEYIELFDQNTADKINWTDNKQGYPSLILTVRHISHESE